MEKKFSCRYDASGAPFHRVVFSSSLALSQSSSIPVVRVAHPWLAPLTNAKRTFLLKHGELVETIDFDASTESPVSAETSRVRRLVVTGGMEPCIAVAISGEKIDAAGRREPSTRVRVFHIYPFNMRYGEEIRAYVELLRRSLILCPGDALHAELAKERNVPRNDALTLFESENDVYEVRSKDRWLHDACAQRLYGMKTRVRVAMHGGTDNPSSLRLSRDLRSLVRELGVEVAFDETCERRQGKNTPLGAVIMEDYRPRFITRLAMAPMKLRAFA